MPDGRTHQRRMPTWPVALVRALVLILALPLLSAGALPLWAQLAGVDGPHVCHCSVERHDCVCPKCNTDREERLGVASLTGRCGDDELAFPGKLLLSVLPPAFMLSPTVRRIPSDLEVPRPLQSRSVPPPTPPPRFLSSRA